jgi:hypothetical protein
VPLPRLSELTRVSRLISLLGLGLVTCSALSSCAKEKERRYQNDNLAEGGDAGSSLSTATTSTATLTSGSAEQQTVDFEETTVDAQTSSGEQTGVGATCTVGDLRCQQLTPERCSEAGAWVASQASCAVACLAGACVACVEGSTACRDGAVQKCMAGVWEVVEACQNACEADACVDACTEGLLQCNGTRVLQKCIAGRFVDETTCEVICNGNECSGECLPDERRCNPDASNESQVCNALGHWDQSAACGEGTFCVNGDCKACEPGAARCSNSTTPQLCSEAGEWVSQPACGGLAPVCLDGACSACTPGEKRCGTNVVEQCASNGDGWDVVATCSGDTPACLDQTKSCGACASGETRCLGDVVQTCSAQGDFEASETCSATTPQCVGDKCTECDPAASERRCASTGSYEACGADGNWGSAMACTGDTPLCREDLGFVCGCEEGTRRCRNNSVPEQCQGGAWVAQASCTGTLDYCLPQTGLCVDCLPGTPECRNGIAHQCGDTGSFQSLNSCSGAGVNCGDCGVGDACTKPGDCETGICVASECAECTPGARDCLGSTPRLCSATGAWVTQSACSGSTPECLPSTGLCVACTNGASRSCGDCNSGTQSCSNNRWNDCAGAVDLQSSGQNCGSCGNVCSSYVGTTGACGGGQCTCESSTALACAASTPTCGSWDFNGNKLEEWTYGDYRSSDHHWVGELTTAVTNGSAALTAKYDGTAAGYGIAEFEVDLCPNGSILNLTDYVLSYDYYFRTTGGSRFSQDPEDGNDSFLVNDSTVLTGCQPFDDIGSDEWIHGDCANLPASVTNLTIVFRLDVGWAGSIYLDNVKLTPK